MDVAELIKRLENIPDKTLQVKLLDANELINNDNYEYVDVAKVYTEKAFEYLVEEDGEGEWGVTKFIAIEQEI